MNRNQSKKTFRGILHRYIVGTIQPATSNPVDKTQEKLGESLIVERGAFELTACFPDKFPHIPGHVETGLQKENSLNVMFNFE